jgi:magnesium-protoporphyrin O-methyltransferase
MTSCCGPGDCEKVFTSRYARRKARELRTTGLDDTAAQMAEFLVGQGIDGASILEIGGGVGGFHTELLRRGAAHATNIELSGAYESEAAQLLAELRLEDRVNRRLGDIVTDSEAVAPADVVLLHRVVCCYPDFEGLLGAAADHARRMVVFSFPRRNILTRVQTSIENGGYALRRRRFRTFVHSPDAMADVLPMHGHTVVQTGRSRMWEFACTVASGTKSTDPRR